MPTTKKPTSKSTKPVTGLTNLEMDLIIWAISASYAEYEKKDARIVDRVVKKMKASLSPSYKRNPHWR